MECRHCGKSCDRKEPYRQVMRYWDEQQVINRLQALESRVENYALDDIEMHLTTKEIDILKDRVSRHNAKCRPHQKIGGW